MDSLNRLVDGLVPEGAGGSYNSQGPDRRVRLTWLLLGGEAFASANGYKLSIAPGRRSYLANYSRRCRDGVLKKWTRAGFASWLEAQLWLEALALDGRLIKARRKKRPRSINWERVAKRLDWNRVGDQVQAEMDGVLLRFERQGRGFRGYVGEERRGFYDDELQAMRTLARLRATRERWQPRRRTEGVALERAA